MFRQLGAILRDFKICYKLCFDKGVFLVDVLTYFPNFHTNSKRDEE